LAASKQRRWKCLLDKNRQGTLTEPEQRELGQLTGGADRLPRSLAVIILSTNSLTDASAGRGGYSVGLATGAAGIVSGRDVGTVSLRAIGF
jgi:hypothetical protein